MTEAETITIIIGVFINIFAIICLIYRKITLDQKHKAIKENPSWYKLQKFKRDINFILNDHSLFLVDKLNRIKGLVI